MTVGIMDFSSWDLQQSSVHICLVKCFHQGIPWCKDKRNQWSGVVGIKKTWHRVC